MKPIRLFVLLIYISFGLQSQTPTSSTEIGLLAGDSYYLGELNNQHFIPFNLGAGVYYQYNYNERFGIKAAFNYGTIEGSDNNLNSTFSEIRQLSFKSKIFELSISGTFNFLPYSYLNEKSSPFTPYGFIGFGYFMHAPKSDDGGTKTDLQLQETEGKKYSRFQASLPLGLGIKYRTGKFGFGFEWGIRKTFTDYLDDVSSYYFNESIMVDSAQKTNVSGFQRGQLNNKDWFVFTGITLFVNLTSKRVCP